MSIRKLQLHVKKLLKLKRELGLFEDPYIPAHIDPVSIVEDHQDLALEAASKSVVLLKNEDNLLPLSSQKGTIALIGPFADTLNFGDYSGTLGQQPAQQATTLRQAMLENVHKHDSQDAPGATIKCAWGANSWNYENQYAIPPYLLSHDGIPGGLMATYYQDHSFQSPRVTRQETPALDWGLYPPAGLPSNNFSALWQGHLESPVDSNTLGTIGVAVGASSGMRLFIDGKLLSSHKPSAPSDILPNIVSYEFTQANATQIPPNGAPFLFKPGVTHHIRIEYVALNREKRIANEGSVNSQVLLWWNLVSQGDDAVSQAVALSKDADVVVLALGSAWNSDGESSDSANLALSKDQDRLARTILDLGKPVVLALSGGRPLALPEHYAKAKAVLSTFYGGQASGRAVANVLTGRFNPGGRLPISIPRHPGQLPAYYNMKPSARLVDYNDDISGPLYPFGHGMSYTTFSVTSMSFSTPANEDAQNSARQFSEGDELAFSVAIANTGSVAGCYVAQIYLLGRTSQITQPVRQLVAFQRVYIAPNQTAKAILRVDVDRYLKILNRNGKWELERGNYTFAVLENGGSNAAAVQNITLWCV